MAEIGILGSDARVELLDGDIVEMSPIGPRHNAIVDRLADFFVRAGAGTCICRVQGSIALVGESEPEPDLAILKYREDFYSSALPTPDDVLLIIEVAESSVELDLGEKARLYAESGIQEYWVIDVTKDHVVTHQNAAASGYSMIRQYDRESTLTPIALPDIQLELSAFLRI